ncbi:hypothetical protein M0R45_020166 [Rubus argutus]|uniref:Uncharacterized protein n=1 Tax=Rubus argutus TaxID=59490 RepID=A0AAW1X8D9_RUBAR
MNSSHKQILKKRNLQMLILLHNSPPHLHGDAFNSDCNQSLEWLTHHLAPPHLAERVHRVHGHRVEHRRSSPAACGEKQWKSSPWRSLGVDGDTAIDIGGCLR